MNKYSCELFYSYFKKKLAYDYVTYLKNKCLFYILYYSTYYRDYNFHILVRSKIVF